MIRTQLGDVAEFLNRERVPLSMAVRETRRGPFPYYGATGVLGHVDGYLFDGLHVLIGEDGTVVDAAGHPFRQLVDGRFWVSNHAHVVKGSNDTDTRYLFYALGDVQVSPYVSGSAQPKLSLGNARQIPVAWPDAAARAAAVAVLGALDDKIASNRRLTDLLLRSCQAAFDFRFADRAIDAPIVDLADVVDCLHAKKPERRQHGRVLLQLKNIVDDGTLDPENFFPISERDYALWTANIEVAEGDLVITNVGRVAAVARIPAGFSGALGRNMTAVRPRRSEDRSFLAAALTNARVRATMMTLVDSGTIMDALNVHAIRRVRVPVCDPQERARFADEVASLLARADRAVAESRTLGSLRDALLPELLSGRMRARDLEATAEEIA